MAAPRVERSLSLQALPPRLFSCRLPAGRAARRAARFWKAANKRTAHARHARKAVGTNRAHRMRARAPRTVKQQQQLRRAAKRGQYDQSSRVAALAKSTFAAQTCSPVVSPPPAAPPPSAAVS